MTQHTILWFVFGVYCGHFFSETGKIPPFFLCLFELHKIQQHTNGLETRQEQIELRVTPECLLREFATDSSWSISIIIVLILISGILLRDQCSSTQLIASLSFSQTQKNPPHRLVLVCELYEVQRNHK